MKSYLLGRFPRLRGVIILLFILSITPAFFAAWMAFQQTETEDRDTKIADIHQLLEDEANPIDIVDLNLHRGRIRAARVRQQDIIQPAANDNVQPPEDCFQQFGELQNPKRFEICVAYFISQQGNVDHLYFYIDYCTQGLQGKDPDDVFTLALTTPGGNKRWSIDVDHLGKADIKRIGTRDNSREDSIYAEFWSPVNPSQRCLDSKPKQRLRLRMDACATFPSREQCPRPISSEGFEDWIHAVLINFSRSSSFGDEGISTENTAGSSRGPNVNALHSVLDSGESVYFGRCPVDGACDCFSGTTSFIDSEPLSIETVSGIQNTVARAIFGFQPSSYCSTPKNNIWLSYERSAELNLVTPVNYLNTMLPIVGYSILALLAAVLVVYLLLGRPLVHLTAGLIKTRNWDPDTPIDIPYVKSKHEIGTVAKAFRYVLLKMRKQLNRERQLANELKLKSERDRDINSIIAHEIKSPFHNLKNKYSDNIDIARIDTALEAILRIDQAVQSSSDEVFVVNISDYLKEYIDNKEDVDNITLEATADVAIEIRGLLLWLVLDNIIANADRFRSSKDSPIQLVVEETEQGCHILISNDGPAIPKDKMETVFNLRYTNSLMANTNEGSNQGIGLFISRHYMRMLGGDLKLLERSEGVTFELSLQRTK
ncbi:MAG: HAMP domain-containing sensor histidine kinase [Gammaproteobacteria bacterium]|nr:HAMP domain-containing sensor histidine kinase [Gammaproteobacteria bacterium]